MAKKYYGYFPLNLYRLGKKDDNKLDTVRGRDIEKVVFYRHRGVDSKVETGRSGEVCWVKGGSNGGISLFDDIETAPIKGKFWYKIPEGVTLPPELGLADSRKAEGKSTHYRIFPVMDMSLDNFKILLRQIAEDVKIQEMFIRLNKNVKEI